MVGRHGTSPSRSGAECRSRESGAVTLQPALVTHTTKEKPGATPDIRQQDEIVHHPSLLGTGSASLPARRCRRDSTSTFTGKCGRVVPDRQVLVPPVAQVLKQAAKHTHTCPGTCPGSGTGLMSRSLKCLI